MGCSPRENQFLRLSFTFIIYFVKEKNGILKKKFLLLFQVPGTIAKKINIARFILLYVRKFEDTDPKEALHYFYFLRHLRKNEEDKSSTNLFMSCVR